MARSRLALVAAIAVAATLDVIACTSFDDDVSPDPSDAANDGTSSGEASDAPVLLDVSDAAEAARPFCEGRDATVCIDFSRPPATLGFDRLENPTLGTLEWTEAGATEPGSASFVTAAFAAGAGMTAERIYLKRLPGSRPATRTRFEMAVRFDMVPEFGDTAPVRLIIGNAIFYAYYSQTGYSLAEGYYGAPCGAGPCGGSTHPGTRLPVPLGQWDRLTITLEPEDAGGVYRATLETASGENISFLMNAFFQHYYNGQSYFGVGFMAATGSDAGRALLVDDVALTVTP